MICKKQLMIDPRIFFIHDFSSHFLTFEDRLSSKTKKKTENLLKIWTQALLFISMSFPGFLKKNKILHAFSRFSMECENAG